jgi:hypothetical protein
MASTTSPPLDDDEPVLEVFGDSQASAPAPPAPAPPAQTSPPSPQTTVPAELTFSLDIDGADAPPPPPAAAPAVDPLLGIGYQPFRGTGGAGYVLPTARDEVDREFVDLQQQQRGGGTLPLLPTAAAPGAHGGDSVDDEFDHEFDQPEGEGAGAVLAAAVLDLEAPPAPSPAPAAAALPAAAPSASSSLASTSAPTSVVGGDALRMLQSALAAPPAPVAAAAPPPPPPSAAAAAAPAVVAGAGPSGPKGFLAPVAEGGDDEDDAEEEEEEDAEVEGGASSAPAPSAPSPRPHPSPPPAPVPGAGAASSSSSSPSSAPPASGAGDDEESLAAAFESATAQHAIARALALESGGGAEEMLAPVAYAEAAQHLLSDAMTRPHRGTIVTTAPDPSLTCIGKLLAPSLREGCWAERDALFCAAKAQYDADDAVHTRLMRSLYSALTGKPIGAGVTSWQDVGFQRDADFTTDLRGGGMLGPLQMHYLAGTYPWLARLLVNAAASPVRGFPLMATAINFTARTLHGLRVGQLHGALNRAYGAATVAAGAGGGGGGSAGAGPGGRGGSAAAGPSPMVFPGPVSQVFHDVYCAQLYDFVLAYEAGACTVAKMGPLLVEASAIALASPDSAIGVLRAEHRHWLEAVEEAKAKGRAPAPRQHTRLNGKKAGGGGGGGGGSGAGGSSGGGGGGVSRSFSTF